MEVFAIATIVVSIIGGFLWIGNIISKRKDAEEDARIERNRREIDVAAAQVRERYAQASERVERTFYNNIISMLARGGADGDYIAKRVLQWGAEGNDGSPETPNDPETPADPSVDD